MQHFWIGFTGGTLAFVHCLGMCGGFALHLSRAARPAQALGRQLLWHAGRTCTYAFLGALAGFGGSVFQALAGLARAQQVLAYAAGGVMILMSLVLFGLFPAFDRNRPPREAGGLWSALLRGVFKDPTAGGALALGLATGFLPCPIVLALLAYAAHTGSVSAGLITMAAMGLGTLGPLLLLGLTGHLASRRLRRWGSLAAAVVLALLGLVTILRTTETFHHLLGCPRAPASAACCAGEQ